MKRVLALMAVLIIAAVGIFCAVGATVNAKKDQVVITENIMYGDKSSAEGIIIENQSRYGRHLFWNTKYTSGESAYSKTEFIFSETEIRRSNPRRKNGNILETDIAYGCDFKIPAEEQQGIARVYKELYDSAKPGEELKKVISLKDYYEYYPIGIAIDLPDISWNVFSEEYHVWQSEENDYKHAWRVFNEFFKIPVPENIKVELSISKGDKSSVSIGVGSSYVGGDDFYLSTLSTYSDNKCFFTIDNRTRSGNIIDTSLIPGGYGIYAFSYGREAEKYETKVDADSLQMVYALDEEAEVCHLSMNHDKTKLLLFLKNGEKLYMSVIDSASMAELQNFSFGEGDIYEVYEYGAGWGNYDKEEDRSFIVLYLSESRICVIEMNEAGEYEHKFTVDAANVVNPEFGYWSSPAFNFDGERLAMVDYMYIGPYVNIPSCGYYMAVYTKDGLMYYAEYESSLSVHPNTDLYEKNCLPADDNRKETFKVRFSKEE